MAAPASEEMRNLLQEFVDAQIDAPALLARAGKFLSADADAITVNDLSGEPRDGSQLLRFVEVLGEAGYGDDRGTGIERE